MQIFFQGLLFGLAYIAPIGMQNLFVVNTAIEQPRRRAFIVAVFVIFFDVSLSIASFYGIGRLLQSYQWLELVVLLLGGGLVIWIGVGLLRASAVEMKTEQQPFSYRVALVTAFSVAWLNPQAIIDGTMLLGAFRVSIPAALTKFFIAGVILASIIWFFSLTGLIGRLKQALKPSWLLWINRICGVIIIGYGIKLLITFATKI